MNDPETGLVYMQARYYDAEVGRFLSVDPVNSATGNQYAYANNNPLKYLDPDGRQAKNEDRKPAPNDCNLACKQEKQRERIRKFNEPFTGGGLQMASKYGRYKAPSNWSFMKSGVYAYSNAEEGTYTFSEVPLSDLRGVFAITLWEDRITVFFKGAFEPMKNQDLYYLSKGDISRPSLERRVFNMSAFEVSIFVAEHEFVHISTTIGDDSFGEGEANYWADEAVKYYRARTNGKK